MRLSALVRRRPAVVLLATLSAALAAVTGCRSSTADVPAEMRRVAFDLPQTDGPAVVSVRSEAFREGGEIPDEYSAYHQNISPPLDWSGVPQTAPSLVVMVEDPDAPPPASPFVHWLVYNLSPAEERLRQDVAKGDVLDRPAGFTEGDNSTGSAGYLGPKPPKADPPHHYHFQVFALDKKVELPRGATRQELLRAMDGHVVGKGRLVGTYYER